MVLAEDDVLLREGLAGILERSGFEIVGQAGDSTQLLTLVHEQAPALVVVDIRMPPTHSRGSRGGPPHPARHPETGILVLSAHVEVEYATELLASGRGIGYLLKSSDRRCGIYPDAATDRQGRVSGRSSNGRGAGRRPPP